MIFPLLPYSYAKPACAVLRKTCGHHPAPLFFLATPLSGKKAGSLRVFVFSLAPSNILYCRYNSMGMCIGFALWYSMFSCCLEHDCWIWRRNDTLHSPIADGCPLHQSAFQGGPGAQDLTLFLCSCWRTMCSIGGTGRKLLFLAG